jgi:hypothetical protein
MFFPCSTEDEDVVQVHNHKYLVNGCKISSIIRIMNIVGTLGKSNNMTNQYRLKRPSLDLKVVFHTLDGFINIVILFKALYSI